MMRIRAVLALCLLFPAFGFAQEGKVIFSANPRSVSAAIGEPVRVEIIAEYPKEAQLIWPPIGADWKEASVERSKQEPPQTHQGRVVERRAFWLSSFAIGEHALSTGKFIYRGLDGKSQEMEGPKLKLTVKSLLPEKWQPLDIKPIKPALLILPPWLIAALVLFALAATACFLYWRQKKTRISAAAGSALRPAHELALEALAQLRSEQLPQRGEFERYYVRLSGIVRAYIERRFQLRAPEMTTEEFLKNATKASELSVAHQILLREFLAQSDLVKFAKYRPNAQEAEAAFEAANRFVHETIPMDKMIDAAVS